MVLTVKPILTCNINCLYCYQHDFHPHLGSKGTQTQVKIDWEAIKGSVKQAFEKKITKYLVFHGGEPTLLPLDKVKEICEIVKGYGGRVGIQTNGYLINDEWIELFKRYRFTIGISIDGPGPLNAGRGFFDTSGQRINPASDKYTEKVMENLRRLRREGLSVGIICVLNRFNGLNPQRQKLKEWLLELREIGIKHGNLNLAFIDDKKLKPLLELKPEEAKECYLDLAEFIFSYPDLDYQPFRQFVNNLLGRGLESCHMTGCDVEATEGEINIDAQGRIINCTRLIRDGQPTLRKGGLDGKPEFHRSLHLYRLPMHEGGCGGCRYWCVCMGGCPAEGWDFKTDRPDWYSKTRTCMAIYALYEYIEGRLKALIPSITTVPDYVSKLPVEAQLESVIARRRHEKDFNPLGF